MYGNAENTKKYYKDFGERLTNRMRERHVTQAQLSQDLKIPKGTVSNWMNGKRLPRAGAMDALCRYLQCTRADLMDDPDGAAPTTELTAEMAREVFGPQEPAEGARDVDLDLVCDAIVSAGYGHLEALFRAAAGADEKSIAFVTGILERNQKKITT